MKDGPSEQKNVNVWVRKGQTLWYRSYGSSTSHHLPQPFFVNEHGTTQRDSGKETTVLFWYILFPPTRCF